jgi:hypothetical protein
LQYRLPADSFATSGKVAMRPRPSRTRSQVPPCKFPLKWPIFWGYLLFGCAFSGLIIFTAIIEDHDFAPLFVLFAGCIVLAVLGSLPATLTIDSNGRPPGLLSRPLAA